MPHNHHHRQIGYRNSTIKQEQQQANNNNGLQNDSSISMHEEQNGVYYYDLDYSDQNINQGVVSSSDENQREITHEEFMHMIVTNQQQRNKTQSDIKRNQHAQDNNYSYDNRHHVQFPDSRSMRSNQPNRQHFKRYTPSTRDKSYQFHSYQINYLNKHENIIDPQKSASYNKNQISKQTSFNNIQQQSVKQFRIDSFLNAQSYHYPHQQQRQPQNNNHRNKRQIHNNKPQLNQQQSQDQSFSLITLPQYDDESYSSLSRAVEKQNISINKKQQQININRRNIRQKYQNVAKLQQTEEEDNYYQKLNWRYQQAKLKFMDNFLPQQLKIGSNSYNMLKYINKKHQLTYNMLMM